mmetsp:Transcript_79919/g.162689  ORF Transcript_79919/g.162689 Transcript_79919/m.162689 type:complete len:224 (+) Transcript_79919:651-1322(+)
MDLPFHLKQSLQVAASQPEGIHLQMLYGEGPVRGDPHKGHFPFFFSMRQTHIHCQGVRNGANRTAVHLPRGFYSGKPYQTRHWNAYAFTLLISGPVESLIYGLQDSCGHRCQQPLPSRGRRGCCSNQRTRDFTFRPPKRDRWQVAGHEVSQHLLGRKLSPVPALFQILPDAHIACCNAVTGQDREIWMSVRQLSRRLGTQPDISFGPPWGHVNEKVLPSENHG